jgi:ATP-dependent exoDNAse (exonuclease V) alpha subunit
MLAHRRDDVRDLNDAARTLLIRAGRLGADALELGEREFRVGDRVICRRNDTHLGIRNGTRATIVALDTATLTLRTDSGALHSVGSGYASEHLEHGYALTGHAAQGATVERAFVLIGDEGALQEWGYVACSRARAETRIYLTSVPRERDTHERQPAGTGTPERVARALTTSAAEPLALAQSTQPSDPTARALAARARQLEQLRTRAEQQLAQAETELDRLGWRARRKHGDQIRTEIGFRRAALRLANEKLTQPLPASNPHLARADHDGSLLTPERSEKARLSRERLERTRAAERGRGLGLER